MVSRFASFASAIVVLAFLIGAFATADSSALQAQEKKKEKNPLEGKRGKTVGTVSAKDKNTIDVLSPGDEKARKFFPHWKGGAPAQGGGLDKDMLKIFSELKIGTRVEIEWIYEERLRAEKVTVLKTPEKEKGN